MNERVMNVAKWSRNVSMSIVLGIFLAACGDDDSSFAPRDEDSSSSICEDCDEMTSSSSVIPASSGDLQSSSSKKETSNSSSKEIASSSSTPRNDNSSSSVKSSSSEEKDKSSSSEKVESSSSDKIVSSSSEKSSSSSVKSSSSVTPQSSSSAKSSSSVTPQSSSSVPSSSGYVPYDHMADLGDAIRIKSSDYKTFVDERNGRSYYYITINGKNKKGEAASVTVMAENLNIGKMVGITKDQANDTLIERYCYDRDTTNCDRYGGLYQWAEMMQLPSRCNTESCADLIQEKHQGICPDGWRLLTQDDFYVVLNADNNKYGIKGVRSEVFGGQNSTGYSLVGAGVVADRKCQGIVEYAYWYYPDEYEEDSDSRAYLSATSRSGTGANLYRDLKTNGLSVRCVKLEE